MAAVDGSADLLLVDDNPANLRVLSQMLIARGHRVRAVTGGPRALTSAEMQPPDLILLDIRMPGMDGYEVCRQLKTSSKAADIPVLFISALDDTRDKVAAFAAGGVDYITKPFQLEEVIARVETHLALRRLQRNLQEANRRMQRELALAATVQASFMPHSLPSVDGWQLAVSLVPAQLTSGDFYDAIPLPGGGLAILIADVVDKGVGAALYMAMCCALLRAYVAEHPGRPEHVCRAVNAHLLEYAGAGQFVTLFLGMLNTGSGELVYANAGHNPPILLAAGQPAAQHFLRNTGLPLGVMEDASWEARRASLEPGDLLILYTDGVTDAERADHEPYEVARLTEVARACVGLPAMAVRDRILASVQEFVEGAPQGDDMALMVLLRAGAPERFVHS